MSTLFKTEEARNLVMDWHERFRTRLKVETESRVVDTTFGETHLLVAGPRDAKLLIALHGALASSAHIMVELGPLLTKYRVYAVDVIGQSVKSANVRLSVSNNDYGNWLTQVMDGLIFTGRQRARRELGRLRGHPACRSGARARRKPESYRAGGPRENTDEE